jgi:hypothetical protein
MGLFWDLYQQSQISQHAERTASVETRVQALEDRMARIENLLHAVIGRLEVHLKVDLNRDGQIGR